VTIANKNKELASENNLIIDGNVTLSVSELGLVQALNLENLNPGSSSTKVLSFTVPSNLTEEKPYKVEIVTQGFDQWPVEYRLSVFSFFVNITRRLNDVVIENAAVNYSPAQCVSTVQLDINVTNRGKATFNNVNVSVTQSALGL